MIVSPGSPGKGQGGEGDEDGGEDDDEGKYEGRPGVARPLNRGKNCTSSNKGKRAGLSTKEKTALQYNTKVKGPLNKGKTTLSCNKGKRPGLSSTRLNLSLLTTKVKDVSENITTIP